MTESLARVLSEIDDPETVRDVLNTAGNVQTVRQNSGSVLDQPTLGELFERYFKRRQNRRPATRSQYKRTIPVFVEFAEAQGITKPERMSTELIDAFVDELQEEFRSDATILTYTKNVRTWLKWLHKRDYCTESIYRILDQDELGLVSRVRDEAIPEAEAMHILENLRQKRRGSKHHALFELEWNAGSRIGGVHSLDRKDFDPANTEIRFRNRPQTGTVLKNGEESDDQPGDGERNVEVKECVIEAIQCYIKSSRPDVTDDYGREPLFATEHGRASTSTLRRWTYEATSCLWAPESSEHSCDGACDPDSNVCPFSYYPHAIRRGAIVHHLSGGLRPDHASGRFDVSTKVIKKHYDPRTKRQRKRDRAKAVRDAW
jgi:site-specific recombinase XerD